MLAGRSVLHVRQGPGRIYSVSELKGYYNDLTEKVKKYKTCGVSGLPLFAIEDGSEILFPIEIFQYGLGAYDLFLMEKDPEHLEKFQKCADWAVDNQERSGAWNAFYFKYPEAPYSAMAQGEGISLLVRAHKALGDVKYMEAAARAAEFLLMPLEEGGTAGYSDDDIFLHEYTHKPMVLNGWIFAVFGLFDYLKAEDNMPVREAYRSTISTMMRHLDDFDSGYWSKYDSETMLASPFYHRLHITQLEVLHQITGEAAFKKTAEKWTRYQQNPANRLRAFTLKACQKLFEK